MTFSFSRIGVWRLLVPGVALAIFHLTLQSYRPELKLSLGAGILWAKALVVCEAALLLVSSAAVIGLASKSPPKSRWWTNELIAAIAGLAVYWGLFIWIFG